MLRLNREIRTKSGEKVIPYLIEDTVVYAFDKNGIAKAYKLSDFNNVGTKVVTPRKKTNVIMVKGNPPRGMTEDQPLFHPDEGGFAGGIYEEKEPIKSKPVIITKPEPDKETETVDIVGEEVEETIPEKIHHEPLPVIDANEGKTTGSAGSSFEPKKASNPYEELDDFYGDM